MASCACKNKIRIFYRLFNISQNFVGGNMTVSFIYNAEFLYIKMGKGVIIYAFVCRYFKISFQMIPVVVAGNCIFKGCLVKGLFFKLFEIIIYYMNRSVIIKLPLIKNPIFFISVKNANNLCIIFYAKITIWSVSIIFFCNFRKKIFYERIINLYVIINFSRIKK